MKVGINNMVCPRCIEAVEGIVREMHLTAAQVELGSVELERRLTDKQQKEFAQRLQSRGFELVLDRESELVNMVKAALINYLGHLENSDNPEKLSFFVSKKTNYNYSYLSKIFSEKKKMTIETFLIELKIERVKELLSFKKWTLSEIAWKLKYSSVQYLSNQFKKVTGITVTEYLREKKIPRKSFDQI
jgi:AraC family transcriptional regulator